MRMASNFDDVQTLLFRAIDVFQSKFGCRPNVAACGPGRVNLIGDHVDYNGGFVLPMALPMVTVAVGRLNGSDTCRIQTDSRGIGSDEAGYVEFKAPTEACPIQPGTPKWANYVKGVVACFHGPVNGFDCVVTSSVPVGAGLSSSAALEVATYTFLELLMNNPSVNLKEKALACQKAEQKFAQVPCGIMDQFISSMGKEGHALLIDCKWLEGTLIPLQDPDVSILIIDSGVKHQLSGSEYPQRLSQCHHVASALNRDWLCGVSRQELEDHKDRLEAEPYRRALHVINETEYTTNFVRHLQHKEYKDAGACMFQSHESLKNLFNVSVPELDLIVDTAATTDGVYGARMTGGGFGGCVVSLVLRRRVDEIISSIAKECLAKGVKPTFYICAPFDGARALSI